jgi:adenylate kinase family enzyme
MKYNPPPKWIDKDDLIRREDDNPEIVRDRYEIFIEETAECLNDAYIKDVQRLDIDATQSIGEVYKEAENFLTKIL